MSETITAWLIETSDGRYLRFDDETTSFVWTRDVHSAHRYRSEQDAKDAWLVITDHDELLDRQSRGIGVRFTEHQWG
jgi:hypothetical protein